jgi:hypothetical protein
MVSAIIRKTVETILMLVRLLVVKNLVATNRQFCPVGHACRGRNDSIGGWRIGIVFLVLTLLSQLVLAQTSRPNVVVLLADDLGWQDIGCYGGPVKTPALDRLATDGIRFTQFYSSAPVC